MNPGSLAHAGAQTVQVELPDYIRPYYEHLLAVLSGHVFSPQTGAQGTEFRHFPTNVFDHQAMVGDTPVFRAAGRRPAGLETLAQMPTLDQTMANVQNRLAGAADFWGNYYQGRYDRPEHTWQPVRAGGGLPLAGIFDAAGLNRPAPPQAALPPGRIPNLQMPAPRQPVAQTPAQQPAVQTPVPGAQAVAGAPPAFGSLLPANVPHRDLRGQLPLDDASWLQDVTRTYSGPFAHLPATQLPRMHYATEAGAQEALAALQGIAPGMNLGLFTSPPGAFMNEPGQAQIMIDNNPGQMVNAGLILDLKRRAERGDPFAQGMIESALRGMAKGGRVSDRKRKRKRNKIEEVIGEFNDGELRTSSGHTVTNRDQAVAIAMSKAGLSKRRPRAMADGGMVPWLDAMNQSVQRGMEGLHPWQVQTDPLTFTPQQPQDQPGAPGAPVDPAAPAPAFPATPQAAPLTAPMGASPGGIAALSNMPFFQPRPVFQGQRFAEPGMDTVTAETGLASLPALSNLWNIYQPATLANMFNAATTGDMLRAGADAFNPLGGLRYRPMTFDPANLEQIAFGVTHQPVDQAAADFTRNPFIQNLQGLGARQWTDPGVWQQYMSPYMQGVVDVAKAEVGRDYDERTMRSRLDAAQRGGFGGTRQAVLEGMLERERARDLGEIQTRGLQQAWEQGLGAFDRDRSADLQAQIGNLGQQIRLAELQGDTGLRASLADQQAHLQSQLANQQAAMDVARLGEQSRQFGAAFGEQTAQTADDMFLRAMQIQEQLRQSGLGAALAGYDQAGRHGQWGATLENMMRQSEVDRMHHLAQVGAAGDQRVQDRLDWEYQNWINTVNFPHQLASYYSGILSGVPVAFNQEQQMFAQRPNLWAQLAGLGIAGAGMLGGGGLGGLGGGWGGLGGTPPFWG